MRLCYIAYVHGFRTHTSFSLRIRSFETHENITIEGRVVVLAYVRVYVSHTQTCFHTRKRLFRNYAGEEKYAHTPEKSWNACI